MLINAEYIVLFAHGQSGERVITQFADLLEAKRFFSDKCDEIVFQDDLTSIVEILKFDMVNSWKVLAQFSYNNYMDKE